MGYLELRFDTLLLLGTVVIGVIEIMARMPVTRRIALVYLIAFVGYVFPKAP